MKYVIGNTFGAIGVYKFKELVSDKGEPPLNYKKFCQGAKPSTVVKTDHGRMAQNFLAYLKYTDL